MLRALPPTHPGAHESRPMHHDWRTLRLVGASSVESLNRLLRDRWSVIAVNVDGMSYLPPGHGHDVAALHAVAARADARVEIVLARDGHQGERHAPQQSAVFVGRSVRGRANTDAMPVRMHGWVRTLVIVVGSGDAVVLYERES